MGTGLVIIKVAEMLKEKKSSKLKDLEKYAKDLVSKSRIIVACETVEYLKRGGRVGSAAAFFGGLLNVKPVIGNRDGEVMSISRPRSMVKALSFLRREAESYKNHQGMAVMQLLNHLILEHFIILFLETKEEKEKKKKIHLQKICMLVML